MKQDTIVAISTPPGRAGIGVVRLSGPEAQTIAGRIFRPHNPAYHPFPTHHLILGHIISPDDGQVVDEVLLSAMHGPHSYTREDVVEINCHSGYAVLQEILHLTLQQGARSGQPGRIHPPGFSGGPSRSDASRSGSGNYRGASGAGLKVAAAHLSGGLGKKINGLRESLLDLLARVEADLDFGEELPVLDYAGLIPALEAVLAETEELIHSHVQGRVLREGCRWSWPAGRMWGNQVY